MAEYIERQKVIDMLINAALISDEDGEYSGYCTEDVDIESIPAADVVEVRHGRWEKHPQSNEDDPVYTCSLCKLNVSGFEKRWIKYCPNCGAKMDRGSHE